MAHVAGVSGSFALPNSPRSCFPHPGGHTIALWLPRGLKVCYVDGEAFVVSCMRNFLWVWLLLAVVWGAGCTCVPGELPDSTTSSSSSSSSSGTGGSDLGPCGVDCSKFETQPCTIAVCNTGQQVGQLNTCVVIPSPTGTPCDDGQFCTINDACDNGTCSGGSPNHCGIAAAPCSDIICYEQSKSCDVTPVNDGTACTPTDLCQVNGVCHIGDCVGEPKDCKFSPLNECNKVACDSATGKCVGTPDADKEDAACVLTGPLCSTNKTCSAGQCGGGKPKDCSALNVGCQVGVCNDANGFCGPAIAPVGTSCTEGIPECFVGLCDEKGTCASSSAPNGTACNDHNSCTKTDHLRGRRLLGLGGRGLSALSPGGLRSLPAWLDLRR